MCVGKLTRQEASPLLLFVSDTEAIPKRAANGQQATPKKKKFSVDRRRSLELQTTFSSQSRACCAKRAGVVTVFHRRHNHFMQLKFCTATLQNCEPAKCELRPHCSAAAMHRRNKMGSAQLRLCLLFILFNAARLGRLACLLACLHALMLCISSHSCVVGVVVFVVASKCIVLVVSHATCRSN